MQKIQCTILLTLLLTLLSLGSVAASGTPLMLGNGQALRLDLPLEQNKSYAISVEFRTDLDDAIVTMTLCGIGSNNEVLEYKSISKGMGTVGNWHEVSLGEIQVPQSLHRWELVLEANMEGRYYWQGLKVTRTYTDNQTSDAYGIEKPASSGTIYTGLVVDARHLNLKRGMSPRIYSELGQLIYGGVLASQELVQERGVVGYGSELTPELLARLEMDSNPSHVAPLFIEAIGVADAAQTGVYISAADTRRVLEAMAQYDFFARYAVIFLLQ